MNILICHERFIFRYGADRVLTILGKGLKDLGHNICVMGNHFDLDVVKTFASQIINVPIAKNYFNGNEFTLDWLQYNWSKYFKDKPDIILVAGWPFFSSIPFFRKVGSKVIFIDFGAVPLEGYSGDLLAIQEKLRRLRKHYLRYTSLIIGISNFIVDTQSKSDSLHKVPVQSILLGADHMEMSIWQAKHLKLEKSHGYAIGLLNSLKRQGRKIIFCLGRWEPNCYKNSDAAFEIMLQTKNVFSDCALLILSDPSNTELPSDLKDIIFPIGFPDDDELMEIMKNADLGISFSLWEGFNLPLVEMQWIGHPALAFDIGAHPEVVIHPWYLCKDNNEMVKKVCDILDKKELGTEEKIRSSEKFHGYFRWNRVIQDCCNIFENIIREVDTNNKLENMILLVDVTNSVKDPANSGVIRVTRRLCRQLQYYKDPIFVIWDHGTKRYVLPTKKEFQQLSQFNGPLLINDRLLSSDFNRVSIDEFLHIGKKSAWLLFTETLNEQDASKIRSYIKNRNIHIAAIFYDAISVLRPELCNDEVKNNHHDYMIGLSECDLIIPISNYSANCLRDFWKNNYINGCTISANLLPGEFGGYKRSIISLSSEKDVRILCVSILEPRKNHIGLIKACLAIKKKYPDLNWSLTLVGNRYAGDTEIVDYVQTVVANNPEIKWLGIVDDVALHKLYEESSFTVYPSIIEGFGMPILESIWHGKPCICYKEGVMAELAMEGGCITTDVMDENTLSETIYKLAIDKELLSKLSEDAVKRKIKTWDDYTEQLISMLESQSVDKRNWQEIIYPKCLCDNWQMNDSERLALTALLSRLRPQCSIEIGTYKGGSLSLISQYSKMVFSIDIDPSIPNKFKQFKNVSFLTGPSSIVLPALLKELNESNIPVNFILIDGDHSKEGIKKDISSVLEYVPKKPFFIMMHDSFNPQCRQGMLETNWEKSPYVDFVDIDFIPGRIVEYEGPSHGEMWGGLGIVYFKPLKRDKSLQINCSAGLTFDKLNKI